MLFSPRIAAFCLAALLLGACQKEEPSRSTQAPPPTATPNPVERDPIQEQLNAMAEAMPADLQIGSGDDALTVRRHWRGDDTFQKKFGLGWGDDNVIQLTQFDRDAVLIWRGGTGWRLGHRDGVNFKTARGEQIEHSPNGWVYRSIEKTRFEFDDGGRLRKETTASGAVHNYSYDSAGRLEKVSDTQNQSIQYKYDAAGLVASVQGSNNKSTTYLYENGKLSEAKDSGGSSRSYRYQYDAAGAVIAQVRIVGAVPAVSANAQTIAVGVETVVAPATSTASTAALSNLVRATGVIGTSALTAIALTYAGIETKGWVQAKTEANAAQASAKSIKNALENKLAEILQSDPKKLLPFPDGKTPDPKNPEHLEQLLIELHSNLSNNKKPFEGIVATSLNPEQQSELEAALERARQIIVQTRQLREAAGSARARAWELDMDALQEIKKVVTKWNDNTRPGALRAFGESVESVKNGTVQVQAAAQQLAALQAELQAAIARCEEAANAACAAAGKPDAPAEKLDALIKEATAQISAAKEKIKTVEVITGDTLRDHVTALLSAASQIAAAAEIARSAEWKAASDAVRGLATQRDEINAEAVNALKFIEANQKRLVETLAPFRGAPEAMALVSEMEGVASSLVEPVADWKTAGDYLKMLQTCGEQAARAGQALRAANVEALSTDAVAAIEQVTKSRNAVTALSGDTRGDQALARANNCLAQIPTVAATAPSPSAGADEAVVPDLSAFQNVTEMKAVLAHAELKAQLIAAKDKPPSKDKEFKFAGQAPGPGTKVKRGSTVSIAFYQKFEGATEEAAAKAPVIEGDWFSGRWSGTLIGAESKETKTFEIRKQGDSYVFGAPGVKETFPLRREGEALVAEYKFTMGADVGISIGGKKASAKGTVEHFTVKFVFAPAGSALSATMSTINDKTGKTESTVKGILNRQ